MKEDFQNCFRKWQGWWDKFIWSKRGINGNVSYCNNFLFKHSPYFLIAPRNCKNLC
jgi:hypothetical protein